MKILWIQVELAPVGDVVAILGIGGLGHLVFNLLPRWVFRTHRFVLMGVSTTEPFTISPEILFKRARIIGSTQNDREHLYEALDYVAKGKVRVMTEIFPLEEISNAYDKVANGNVRFKAVIEPIR